MKKGGAVLSEVKEISLKYRKKKGDKEMKTKILLVITLAAVFSLSGVALGAGHHYPSAVYTMTNDAAGNSVLAFHRTWDGRLSHDATYAPSGDGSGNGLGNQGALILSQNRRLLFVANAGSNEISIFAVKR